MTHSYRHATRCLVYDLRLLHFLQRYVSRATGAIGGNSEGYGWAQSCNRRVLISTDRNATVQRHKECVRVSAKVQGRQCLRGSGTQGTTSHSFPRIAVLKRNTRKQDRE